METIKVTVLRAGVIEALHDVHAIAVQDGAVVATAGDPGLVSFFRSCAKPLQALPLVRARQDLDDAEIAITCASHQAERAQLEAVRSVLRKASASQDDLECGFEEGREAQRIYNECSGKHAGMLALCATKAWSAAGYRLLNHPLQQTVLSQIALATDMHENEIATGVEGCGTVTFALPLKRMAVAFARLEQLEGGPTVVKAMRAHPELVGGDGADDTDLMHAMPGWIAKRGAEGLFCAAGPDGIGIALKSQDGSQRPLRPALAAFLGTLGTPLEQFTRVPLTNSRGEVVGEVRARY